MEERIAAFESDVAHIKTDIADMKTDIRDLRGKMDAANDAIAGLRTEVAKQGAELRGEIAQQGTELRGAIEKQGAELKGSLRLSIAANTIGQLLTAATILGIVGRALEWF